MTEPRDPYRVLGVSPNASIREIRDAYRRRARMAHPDLAGEDGASWMRDLNAAWEILKTPESRSEYDAGAGRATAASADDAAQASSAAAGAASAEAGREPWHAAAGPPPARPYGTTLDFGIYAGWSLGQVARRDRGYLVWLKDRPEGRQHRAEIERILGTEAGPGADEQRNKDPRPRR